MSAEWFPVSRLAEDKSTEHSILKIIITKNTTMYRYCISRNIGEPNIWHFAQSLFGMILFWGVSGCSPDKSLATLFSCAMSCQ